MSRYIDVDFLAKFSHWDSVVKQLKCAPTADVQKVRHGNWIEVERDVFECSHCKRYKIHGCFIPKPRYCGNCGARMDGDEE